MNIAVGILKRVKHALKPQSRPPRQVTKTKDLGDDDVAALMAASVRHLKAKPRRLAR